MQNIKVLSKGEYLRPQDFSPVTLIRYIFAEEGGRRISSSNSATTGRKS